MSNSIAQQLALMQLADSFFPSGSFTLSHGLESLVQSDRLNSVADLELFLQLLLRNKIGTSDLVGLLYAHRGSSAKDLYLIREADARLFAQSLIEQTRNSQIKSGRALLMVASSTWQNSQLETLQQDLVDNKFYCLHPTMFGVVSQIAGLNEQDAALAFLHGFVTGLLGAAIRLGVIGHFQAQQVLLNLASHIEQSYHRAQAISLEEMWSCTPQIDLAQMQHHQLNTRLFAS